MNSSKKKKFVLILLIMFLKGFEDADKLKLNENGDLSTSQEQKRKTFSKTTRSSKVKRISSSRKIK